MHLCKLHKSICDKIRVEGIRKNFSESMLGILPVSDNEKNGKLRRTKLRHHLSANAARRKLTVDNAAFAARNEKLREAGTGAQSYAATMIPAVVSIGYLNYAVIAVVGGLMVMWGWSDLGSLASYLVFVRQTTLPINQLTQQGNFLLAALAGAERIFTVMEEKPEIDEGTVELVSVRENSDGTLTECAGSTGRWAWCDRRRPDVPLEPLHGDVPRRQLWLYAGPDDSAEPLALRQAGAKNCLCRLHGRGQDHDYQPHQPLL